MDALLNREELALRTGEVAQLLHVSPATVRRYARQLDMRPALHIAGRWPRWTVEQVQKLRASVSSEAWR